MFQDLDMLVVQQEVAIQAATENAENTTKWTEEGNQHVGKGIKSARNRRKLKWWCLLICILIIIIAVGVGAGMYYLYTPIKTMRGQKLTFNDYRCGVLERALRQQEEQLSSSLATVWKETHYNSDLTRIILWLFTLLFERLTMAARTGNLE
jgi:hypothetical protein